MTYSARLMFLTVIFNIHFLPAMNAAKQDDQVVTLSRKELRKTIQDVLDSQPMSLWTKVKIGSGVLVTGVVAGLFYKYRPALGKDLDESNQRVKEHLSMKVEDLSNQVNQGLGNVSSDVELVNVQAERVHGQVRSVKDKLLVSQLFSQRTNNKIMRNLVRDQSRVKAGMQKKSASFMDFLQQVNQQTLQGLSEQRLQLDALGTGVESIDQELSAHHSELVALIGRQYVQQEEQWAQLYASNQATVTLLQGMRSGADGNSEQLLILAQTLYKQKDQRNALCAGLQNDTALLRQLLAEQETEGHELDAETKRLQKALRQRSKAVTRRYREDDGKEAEEFTGQALLN